MLLICDPGYCCNTKDYFGHTQDQAGQIPYNETIAGVSSGTVKGSVVGVVITTTTSSCGVTIVGTIDQRVALADCAGGAISSAMKWVSNLIALRPCCGYVLQAVASNMVSHHVGS